MTIDYLKTFSDITPVMFFFAFLVVAILFWFEWRSSRRRDHELRMKDFDIRFRKEKEQKEAVNNIVVENSNDHISRDPGGYITLKMPEDKKSIFHDLLKGFEEYAMLKGYKVSVSVDTSSYGEISFKITIDEAGVAPSNSVVKKDLDEYIQNIQDGNLTDELPKVLNDLEHAKLSMALKNRISFLQQNYEVEKNIRQFYENFIKSIPNSSISHALPTIQINSGRLDMDQRKYEANNSANIMQGDNHSNLIEGNTITIGSNHLEKDEQIKKIESLIELLSKENDLELNKVKRNFENIKEEIEESESPDKSLIGKWLSKAKSILITAKEGTKLFDMAKDLYDSFGQSLT